MKEGKPDQGVSRWLVADAQRQGRYWSMGDDERDGEGEREGQSRVRNGHQK